MQTSTFIIPRKIVFGIGAVGERLGKEAKTLGGETVLMITDKGVEKAGIVEKVKISLEREGFNTEIYSARAVEPNVESVGRAVESARKGKHDLVVGLGGGSSMDTAKIVAMMVTNPGGLDRYVTTYNAFKNPGLPKIMIPTTAGTGSEISRSSILTSGNGFKTFIGDERYMTADLAVVDPLLTVTMPRRTTAATGLDALNHAIEGFLNLRANHLTDSLTLQAISLIAGNLRVAYADGENMEARYNMSVAAMMAMMGMINSGLCFAHVVGDFVGPMYKVPHGIACTIALQYNLKYNLIACPHKLVKIAEIMGEKTGGLNLYEGAMKAAIAVRELAEDLNIPTSLREVKVPKEDLSKLAELTFNSLKSSGLARNPREVKSKEDLVTVYEEMWQGDLRNK